MPYRVRVGRDEYVGEADEVVAFLARARGDFGGDPGAYMRSVSALLSERMGVAGIPSDSAEAFLLALRDAGVLDVATLGEPSEERVDPGEVLDEGPVTLGEDVRPEDLPL